MAEFKSDTSAHCAVVTGVEKLGASVVFCVDNAIPQLSGVKDEGSVGITKGASANTVCRVIKAEILVLTAVYGLIKSDLCHENITSWHPEFGVILDVVVVGPCEDF